MVTPLINFPNIDEYKNKLIEFLTESGWRNKLKTFLQSDDFEIILNQLYALRTQKVRFTPPLKSMLNCFAACPYNELKVVIVGPGPYPDFTEDGENIADGLLFSHKMREDGFVKPENLKIREAAGCQSKDTDLTRWANQGVLLLNTALTTAVSANTAHYSLYKSFISFTLDMINSVNQGLVFVFIGPEAEGFAELISEKRHYVYYLYSINQAMNANYTFRQIDKIVLENYQTKINW